jgi:hypothetical protein
MTKNGKSTSELVTAALMLEHDLAELESLARTLRKHRLDSEKSIVRAARELSDVLKLPEALSAGLLALGQAIQEMQQRQQTAIDTLANYAGELRDRKQLLQEYMATYVTLGQAVAEIGEVLLVPDQVAGVASARERLDAVAEGARALSEATRKDDFPELTKEADALKQRATALARRLNAMQAELASKSHGDN